LYYNATRASGIYIKNTVDSHLDAKEVCSKRPAKSYSTSVAEDVRLGFLSFVLALTSLHRPTDYEEPGVER
jgi:hypothetical protein